MLHVNWERGNGLRTQHTPTKGRGPVAIAAEAPHRHYFLFELQSPCNCPRPDAPRGKLIKNKRLEFINTPLGEVCSGHVPAPLLIDRCEFVWRQFHFHAAWRHTRRMRNLRRCTLQARAWLQCLDGVLFSGGSLEAVTVRRVAVGEGVNYITAFNSIVSVRQVH